MYIELSAVYWASVSCAFGLGFVVGIVALVLVAYARDTSKP